jgi:uncharacterized membrane protein YphA (DoxX/SURF4 family)
MNNSLIAQIGKYLFAVPFLIFGLFHFMGADNMASMVPAWLPGGVFWVYLTGVSLVAAAVSIFIGKYTRLACLLLAVEMLVYVFLVHAPGMGSEDEMMKTMATVSALKDLALAGGALILAAKYDQ